MRLRSSYIRCHSHYHKFEVIQLSTIDDELEEVFGTPAMLSTMSGILEGLVRGIGILRGDLAPICCSR